MPETAETTKCPKCNYDNALDAKVCGNLGNCRAYLRSEIECLRSSDASLRTIKRIATAWFILTLLGLLLGFLAAIGAFR